VRSHRVCLITGQYPPDLGGVGNSAKRVASLLASRGIEVHVLHLVKRPEPVPLDLAIEMTREGDVCVHRARVWHPDWRAPGAALTEPEVLTRYNREIFEVVHRLQRRHRFSLLHGFFLYPAGYAAALAARMHGIRSIVSIRGNDVGKYLFDPLRAGFVASALAHADAVTSVARSLLEAADAGLAPVAAKGRVILNSIEPDAFAARRRPALALDSPVIGSAGLFRYKKGLTYLFRALAGLRARQRFSLLLAGAFFDAKEEASHRREIAELGLEPQTHVTGRLSRDAFLDHLALFDVVAFPSLFSEGCPLAMLEALAAGRVVVASRAGAIPEIVEHGESGWLVEPGSSGELETACERLLGDRALRARLSEGARRRAEELAPELERSAWLALYAQVLDSSGERSAAPERAASERMARTN